MRQKNKNLLRREIKTFLSQTNIHHVIKTLENPHSYVAFGKSILQSERKTSASLKRSEHKTSQQFKRAGRTIRNELTSPSFKSGLNYFILAATVLVVLLMIAGTGGLATGPAVLLLMGMIGVVQASEGIIEIVQDPKDWHGYADLVGGLLCVLGPISESASVAVEGAEEAEAASREAVTSYDEAFEFVDRSTEVSSTTKFIASLSGNIARLTDAYFIALNINTSIDDFKHHRYVSGVLDILAIGLTPTDLGKTQVNIFGKTLQIILTSLELTNNIYVVIDDTKNELYQIAFEYVYVWTLIKNRFEKNKSISTTVPYGASTFVTNSSSPSVYNSPTYNPSQIINSLITGTSPVPIYLPNQDPSLPKSFKRIKKQVALPLMSPMFPNYVLANSIRPSLSSFISFKYKTNFFTQ